MRRRPPISTRTATLCPYATLFRSGQTRSAELLIFDDKAPRRIIIATVPQRMESRRQVAQVEGDAVRLVIDGSGFDNTRELRSQLHQRDLLDRKSTRLNSSH